MIKLPPPPIHSPFFIGDKSAIGHDWLSWFQLVAAIGKEPGSVGPVGPAGATGATGAQGPIGSNGAQGPAGSANINGIPGYIVAFDGATNGISATNTDAEVAATVAASHATATVADTSSIDMSISGQQISGAVLPGGVDHAALMDLNSTNYTHLSAANATDLTNGSSTTLHRHPLSGSYIDFAPHNMTSNVLPVPYVASASSEYNTGGDYYPAYKGFDGQHTIFYGRWVSTSAPAWLKIDLGVGIYHLLNNYSIQAHASSLDLTNAPKAWTMEGSNNDSTWDVLHTVTNETSWTSGQIRNYTCAVVSTAYRYFRINISDNNGFTYPSGPYAGQKSIVIDELYLFEGGFGKILVTDITDATTTDASLRTLGGLSVTKDEYVGGDIVLATVGKGLNIKEGTNARMGLATLSAGAITVSTTAVTANSRIILTTQGGTLTNIGAPYVSARTAGTSFTISSTNVLDVSDVAWVILEPSA
jgi:hypothetical protein